MEESIEVTQCCNLKGYAHLEMAANNIIYFSIYSLNKIPNVLFTESHRDGKTDDIVGL